MMSICCLTLAQSRARHSLGVCCIPSQTKRYSAHGEVKRRYYSNERRAVTGTGRTHQVCPMVLKYFKTKAHFRSI